MNVTIIQHYGVIQLLLHIYIHVPSYTHQLSTTALKEDMVVSVLIIQVPNSLSSQVTSSTTNKTTNLALQQSSQMQTYLSTNHASLEITKEIEYFTKAVAHVKSKSLIAHLTATSSQAQDTTDHSLL